MTRFQRIILLVCMNLIGVIIIFVMFMHKREISKYDNATIAKARVTKKESEDVYEGRAHSTNNWIHLALPIGSDTAWEMTSSDYLDNDVYESIRRGSWIDVVYLKESVRRFDNGHIEISEKIYTKAGLDAARARLPWYWLYGGICCLLGFLPYIIRAMRKKR